MWITKLRNRPIFLAGILIALAGGLRLVLIALGWPLTHADEGTVAIAARHIAYNSEHPIYFYGGDYMGLAESYIGAILFHIMGSSLFSLRVGLILLYMLFMIVMYIICRLLFDHVVALLTLVFLVFGSYFQLNFQLHAYGGYPEMLLLSGLLFLIAIILALSSGRPTKIWKSKVLYAAWGLAAGLGVWSDALIMPSILLSGLLLLMFCRRELIQGWLWLIAAGGLIVGLIPVIYYDVMDAAPGRNNIQVLLSMVGITGGQHSLSLFALQVKNVFFVSVPTVTGNPFCPVSEVQALQELNVPQDSSCMLVQGIWSGGYLLLLGTALVVTAWLFWRTSKTKKKSAIDQPETYRNLIILAGRLCLMLEGIITLGIFTLSQAPIENPGNSARYLLALCFAIPCIVWLLIIPLSRKPISFPLTPSFNLSPKIKKWSERLASPLSLGLLVGILGTFALGGLVTTTSTLPFVQMKDQQNQQLLTYLEQHDVHHFYTDYWDCNSLAFLSEEKLVCAVVTPTLQLTHNRYRPYMVATLQDPYAAYVFKISSDHFFLTTTYHEVSVERQLRKQGISYDYLVTNGFVLYLPVRPV